MAKMIFVNLPVSDLVRYAIRNKMVQP